MFFQRGIAPHFFQFIKLAGLRAHYVHNDINIVDEHPLQVLFAFVAIGNFTGFFLYFFFHRIGDGSYLRLVIGFADDEKVGNGLRYLTQIKRYNVFAFFILNSPDDALVNFRGFGKPGGRFFTGGQYI